MRIAPLTIGSAMALTGLSVLALAQGGFAPDRPAPGTDPKKVIFEIQDALGMLRGNNQVDAAARVEYWGTTGSMTTQGRTSNLTNFKVSINYETPGMRFDFTRDGRREIQVVAGKFAWNEDTPGGKAVPMPGAAGERLLQLWLTPLGLGKATAAAGDLMKVTIEGGKTVCSFLVAGASVRATLNSFYQPETVEARMGTTVYNISYSEYGELNDDAKADVFLPRRIVQKKDGVTVLDLTVKNTNTYNPYVIMPVPQNVANAAPGGGH